jgi:hypothetical protein
MDSTVSGYGPMTGCCEHDKEILGSVTCLECLNQMSKHQLLKKNSASWS